MYSFQSNQSAIGSERSFLCGSMCFQEWGLKQHVDLNLMLITLLTGVFINFFLQGNVFSSDGTWRLIKWLCFIWWSCGSVWLVANQVMMLHVLTKWWCLICWSSEGAWYMDQMVVRDMFTKWQGLNIKICWSRVSMKIIWCSNQVDVIEYQVVVINIFKLGDQVICAYLWRQHLMLHPIMWKGTISFKVVKEIELWKLACLCRGIIVYKGIRRTLSFTRNITHKHTHTQTSWKSYIYFIKSPKYV